MDLCNRLREIAEKYTLDKNLTIRVICVEVTYFTGTKELIGKYDGYIQALDNEPEIAQLELKIPQYANGIVSLLETEIKSIDVIN